MLKIHCQGCGCSEPADEKGRAPTIRETRFEVRGFDGSTDAADLCPRCRIRLRSDFYGIPPEPIDPRMLEREAFLQPPEMPDTLEREFAGAR